MAATMMCPAHGPVDGEYCAIPGCFEVLRPHVEGSAPTSACPAPGCGMELPCPLHAEVSANDDGVARAAAAHLAVGAAVRRPRSTAAIEVSLEFPWGAVAVPAGGLVVGRDHPQMCGRQIDTYDNVSRQHARITIQAGSVFVEDLDSTNGTTVNGIRITPRHPTPVAAGDVLGFGNRLRVSVSAGEQP